MKRLYLFVLLFCYSCVVVAQGDLIVSKKVMDKDSLLCYPYFSGIASANVINNYLNNHVKKCFYLNNDESIEYNVNAAISKGLIRLDYIVYESDSLVSVSIEVETIKGAICDRHVDFYTFSKKTGAIKILRELFPLRDRFAIMKDINIRREAFFNNKSVEIKGLYKSDEISEFDYECILYYLRNYSMIYPDNAFLILDNLLIIQNNVNVPYELSKWIKAFFIIDLEELIFNNPK